MSQTSSTTSNHGNHGNHDAGHDSRGTSSVSTASRTTSRRITTETKVSYKTTELIAFVVAVVGVLVAAAVTDTSDFGTQEAWFYVTLLTIGYMISRGLSKSGSSEPFDDEQDARSNNR